MTNILDKQQLNLFFKTIEAFAHAERNRLVIALTYFCALRIGEVAQLRWANVLDKNFVVLNEIIFEKHQVKARQRQKVLLNKRARLEIKRYLDWYVQKHKQVDLNKPLITTQKNTQFTPNSLCISVNALFRKANLQNITSHSGRKAYITQLANKAVNMKVIMQLVRHKHLSTTQRYILVSDEQLTQANELVGKE
jgi:integrase/recombinase XerD